MMSLPSPPVSVSFPLPPLIVSFPSPPLSVSLPPLPLRLSAPSVPVKLSLPLLPLNTTVPVLMVPDARLTLTPPALLAVKVSVSPLPTVTGAKSAVPAVARVTPALAAVTSIVPRLSACAVSMVSVPPSKVASMPWKVVPAKLFRELVGKDQRVAAAATVNAAIESSGFARRSGRCLPRR